MQVVVGPNEDFGRADNPLTHSNITEARQAKDGQVQLNCRMGSLAHARARTLRAYLKL